MMEPLYLGPTSSPTTDPTQAPTAGPTMDPTDDPTTDPTTDPTFSPTNAPSNAPSSAPIQSIMFRDFPFCVCYILLFDVFVDRECDNICTEDYELVQYISDDDLNSTQNGNMSLYDRGLYDCVICWDSHGAVCYEMFSMKAHKCSQSTSLSIVTH